MPHSPSRAAALETLQAFVPRAAEYAAQRNFDRPGHSAVSCLSPYLSRRLITEEEVLRAVLEVHPLQRVEKFVQEVCWRTYWKGWLEMRPAVWQDYRRSLAEAGACAEDLLAATEGRTGIDCFDAWAHELAATGYLHNHARMWFASIWIFTLRLPWQLGAEHFFRHLLDADAASNTLSWRWVAGLHTPGKHYLARAENIRKFTEGRFDPAGQLDETAAPLHEPVPPPAPRLALPAPAAPAHEAAGLLLLGDDLSPETRALASHPFEAIATGLDVSLESDYLPAALPLSFSRGALEDAAHRAEARFSRAADRLDPAGWTASALDWIQRHRLRSVHVAYPATGPWRDSLERLRHALPAEVALVEELRSWDRELWPHATAGFFRFRQRIPEVVKRLTRAS
jgi:deoxyribodipyrimidine photo-lyase